MEEVTECKNNAVAEFELLYKVYYGYTELKKMIEDKKPVLEIKKFLSIIDENILELQMNFNFSNYNVIGMYRAKYWINRRIYDGTFAGTFTDIDNICKIYFPQIMRKFLLNKQNEINDIIRR